MAPVGGGSERVTLENHRGRRSLCADPYPSRAVLGIAVLGIAVPGIAVPGIAVPGIAVAGADAGLSDAVPEKLAETEGFEPSIGLYNPITV